MSARHYDADGAKPCRYYLHVSATARTDERKAWRRCGAAVGNQSLALDPPDFDSPLCIGSAPDGSLNISEAELRARCTADGARCTGYSIKHGSHGMAVPHRKPVSYQRGTRQIDGHDTYEAVDHCVIDHSRAADLASALDNWASEAWNKVLAPKFARRLWQRMSSYEAFANRTLPHRGALPVLYPFSGFDLLSAHAFFPNAPHFVLSSSLPFGDLRCFLLLECRKEMMRRTFSMFAMWERHSFSWTEEAIMIQLLHDQPLADGIAAGLAPLLLVSLAAMGHSVCAVEHSGGAKIAPHVTLRTTAGPGLTYVHLPLGLRPMSEELAMLDGVLRSSTSGNRSRRGGEGDPPRLYASLLKAATLAWPYIREPYFARWLLRRSEILVHDETGLMPSAYEDKDGSRAESPSSADHPREHAGNAPNAWRWRMLRYGNFTALTELYSRLAMPEHWERFRKTKLLNASNAWRSELERAFDGSRELPFPFGYVPHGQGHHTHGVLLVAWRSTGGETWWT